MHVARGDAVLGGVESNLMVASVLLSEFLVPPGCEHSAVLSLSQCGFWSELLYFILYGLVLGGCNSHLLDEVCVL